MQVQEAMTLRSKILGVLIREARQRARKTLKECAAALGCSPYTLSQIEHGRSPVSLPQLEVLAYILGVPLEYFLHNGQLPEEPAPPVPLAEVMALRRRIIGALLRQARLQAGKTQSECAELLGCSVSRISQYEFGQRDIPLPALEVLADFLEVPLEYFLDEQSPLVPPRERERRDWERFSQLPPEVRDFILRPANILYLRIAMKLSALSAEALRAIAEELLEITY